MLLVAPWPGRSAGELTAEEKRLFGLKTVAEYPVDHPRRLTTSIFPRAFKQSRRRQSALLSDEKN